MKYCELSAGDFFYLKENRNYIFMKTDDEDRAISLVENNGNIHNMFIFKNEVEVEYTPRVCFNQPIKLIELNTTPILPKRFFFENNKYIDGNYFQFGTSAIYLYLNSNFYCISAVGRQELEGSHIYIKNWDNFIDYYQFYDDSKIIDIFEKEEI